MVFGMHIRASWLWASGGIPEKIMQKGVQTHWPCFSRTSFQKLWPNIIKAWFPPCNYRVSQKKRTFRIIILQAASGKNLDPSVKLPAGLCSPVLYLTGGSLQDEDSESFFGTPYRWCAYYMNLLSHSNYEFFCDEWFWIRKISQNVNKNSISKYGWWWLRTRGGILRPLTEFEVVKDKTKLPLLADWTIERGPGSPKLNQHIVKLTPCDGDDDQDDW